MSADRKPGSAKAIGDQFWLHDHGPYHVRGFVDDQTIARVWSRGRQHWVYRVFHPVELGVYGVQCPTPSGCGPIGETDSKA